MCEGCELHRVGGTSEADVILSEVDICFSKNIAS